MTERDDREALDEIGALLADAEDWSDPATFLEDIAAIIDGTGRPHPGNFPAGEEGDYLQIVRAERIWLNAAPSERYLARVVAGLHDETSDNTEYARACREIIANGVDVGLNAHDDRAVVDHLIRLAKEN